MDTTAVKGLERRDSVPHFSVRDLGGAAVHYSDIWQHKALLLVCAPAGDRDAHTYAARLGERAAEIAALSGVLVVTSDSIRGLHCPGALVADRWGEIVFVAQADDVSALPEPADLVEWLTFAQMRCPECEGEAR